MKNRYVLKSGAGAHLISIIGLKGLPPEFAGTSGVEFYVAQKIPTLIHRGFSVRCYVRGWATSEDTTHYRGARLIHTPSISVGFLDAATHSFTSTIHACFSSADIVWYHATGSMLFSFLPVLFGKKVFVTVHTLEWRRAKWGNFAKFVLRAAERIGVRSATERFAVSDELGRYIQDAYGKHASVDEPEMMTHARVLPAILKKKYNLSGNDYILYLGRFVSEKRIEWLIRSYLRLHLKNMRLVIAGGEAYGRSYETKLHKMAHGNKDISFVGWVFGETKQALLDNAAFFVLPSSIEGNPVVLRELPFDTPILVSDVIGKDMRGRKKIYTYKQDSEADFLQVFHKMIRRI